MLIHITHFNDKLAIRTPFNSESSTLEACSTVTTKAHHISPMHTKLPRRLYEMHDSGRNLRSQNLALIPSVTTPTLTGSGPLL